MYAYKHNNLICLKTYKFITLYAKKHLETCFAYKLVKTVSKSSIIREGFNKKCPLEVFYYTLLLILDQQNLIKLCIIKCSCSVLPLLAICDVNWRAQGFFVFALRWFSICQQLQTISFYFRQILTNKKKKQNTGFLLKNTYFCKSDG